MKTITKTRLPFFVWFLGVGRGIFNDCSEITRGNFTKLGRALAFTTLICGSMLAFSICQFALNGDYRWLIVLLPFCCAVYFIIDQSIILGQKLRASRKFTALRLVMALVLGLFNSLLVDYYYFKADIEAARNKVAYETIIGIEKRDNAKIEKLNESKTELLDAIDQLNERLSVRLDSLDAEASGRSVDGQRGLASIWNAKYRSFQTDSMQTSQLVTLKRHEISDVEASIAELKEKQLAEKEKAGSTVSIGINQSLKLLHKAMFADGEVSNIAMGVLILLVSLLIELIPFVVKLLFDISEYFKISQDAIDASLKRSDVRKNNDIVQQGQKMVYENKLVIAQLQNEHVIRLLENQQQRVREILKTNEESLHEILETDKRWKEAYASIYDLYGALVIKKAFDTVKCEVEEAFYEK